MHARGTAASRPPGGEAFPRERRVRARGDFRHAYDEGIRQPGQLVVVFALARPAGGLRLGVTATRRVGGAAVRNLARRRVREIFRRWAASAPAAGVDLVVNVSARAAKAPFRALTEELTRLLSRAVAGAAAK
jgi:ribonuclease P protein component